MTEFIVDGAIKWCVH